MTVRRGIGATLAVLIAAVGLAACTRFGATLSRSSEPVVLDGSALPKLLGGAPMHVVGFAWDGSAWHQIPVQVDERDYVSPGVIYHLPVASYPTLFGTNTLYKPLVYTPPPALTAGYTSADTYTPPDSDPTFDANDELSFLANDTGSKRRSRMPRPRESTRARAKKSPRAIRLRPIKSVTSTSSTATR